MMNLPAVITRLFDDPVRQELIKQNKMLMGQCQNLIAEVQGSTDISTNTDSTADISYIGTPSRYSTYTAQVAQLSKLYENIADWGCMIAKNVIDIRTAFSVGEGLEVIKREGFPGSAEEELVWVTEFMRFNGLDEEIPQEYAKEAEIEGKVLFRFLIDEKAKNIRIVHVPWRQFNYTIDTPDYDFSNYIRAHYIGSGARGISFDLPAPFFVYKRFGGNASQPNITPPKSAFVIRYMENLDKAMWDWRKINRLFSAPTPVITAPDKQTAEEINAALTTINWRIGKLLVLGGEGVSFDLVGWKGDGYTTLKEETQGLAKTISGTTGVPVHFLGYPELLSNRDTAENLIKLITLSTTKERRTWIGAYEELFQKAMILYNTHFNTSLNPLAIDAAIKEMEMLEQADEAVPNSNNAGSEPERD